MSNDVAGPGVGMHPWGKWGRPFVTYGARDGRAGPRHRVLADPRPNARYRKDVSVEDVLASAVVSGPLHLLDVCATSDGGAAIVST